MIDLQESRQEIDKIDAEIVRLFEQRMETARNVAAYKIETGRKVFDRQREEDKLNTLMDMAGNDFNRHGIRELFVQIMSMSRKLQYGLIPSCLEDLSFKQVKTLKLEGRKIVSFGEPASYTEQAMEDYFGTGIDSFHAGTFKEVMEAIRDGRAEYGVLPIENTSTGGITDIYDLLVEYDNYIIGEHVVKVDHALLGLPDADKEDIKTVYSHPQGLLQCADYLREHPSIRTMEFSSTSGSARKVLDDGDITQGAIASPRAAQHYGLKVLEESINTASNNSTRFIVITNKKIFFEDASKVSICFELPHASGTLYNMLSHIIYNNLNMTKIESRPLPGRNFEYRFFVDFEGNLTDAGVQNALCGIKEEATELKILGNFSTK